MNSRIACIITMLVLLSPCAAAAHRVSVYAWHEGGSVHAEGYFADGARCVECAVEVRDKATGELLIEGKTGHDGDFSFAPPAKDIRVVVHAGPGHVGEYVLTREDATEAPPPSTVDEEILGQDEAKRKIEDLTAEIRRLREEAQRPGLAEIVGGIGWIVGILGAAAYVKSRRR